MTRSFLGLTALLALVGFACGGGADEGLGPQSSTTSSTAGLTVTSTTDPVTTISASETPSTSGLPLAADFTLQLGQGGTYTLSEGEKPVYLVFWAEW